MAIGFNNEELGISAEIAIADVFGVKISEDYRKRGSKEIIEKIKLVVSEAFSKYNIPRPVKHIAEDQNPIDFLLENRLTLSVKTNQSSLGKAVPQKKLASQPVIPILSILLISLMKKFLKLMKRKENYLKRYL